MKRLLLGACLAFVACGEAVPETGGDAGTQMDAGRQTGLTPYQQAAVDAHNVERANAMPAPSPALAPVTWSASAAALAEDWARRCEFEHRDDNELGENLHANTREPTITEVVEGWAGEESDFTYASNTCRAGKQCGHYTQIVWRSSVGIGCATQRCTTGSPFGSGVWYLVVCNYDPAGNYVGQKPY
ncbi:MAG: CAP domain-containing protein [Archangium sp.]